MDIHIFCQIIDIRIDADADTIENLSKEITKLENMYLQIIQMMMKKS